MQHIILDIITALFGAGIGTGLYLVGKNNGKAQAEKEHLQSMRESFLKKQLLYGRHPHVPTRQHHERHGQYGQHKTRHTPFFSGERE